MVSTTVSGGLPIPRKEVSAGLDHSKISDVDERRFVPAEAVSRNPQHMTYFREHLPEGVRMEGEGGTDSPERILATRKTLESDSFMRVGEDYVDAGGFALKVGDEYYAPVMWFHSGVGGRRTGSRRVSRGGRRQGSGLPRRKAIMLIGAGLGLAYTLSRFGCRPMKEDERTLVTIEEDELTGRAADILHTFYEIFGEGEFHSEGRHPHIQVRFKAENRTEKEILERASEKRGRFDPKIFGKICDRYDIPPLAALSLMLWESRLDPNAVGPTDDKGLYQLIDETGVSALTGAAKDISKEMAVHKKRRVDKGLYQITDEVGIEALNDISKDLADGMISPDAKERQTCTEVWVKCITPDPMDANHLLKRMARIRALDYEARHLNLGGEALRERQRAIQESMASLSGEIKSKVESWYAPFNPDQNVLAGTWLQRDNLDRLHGVIKRDLTSTEENNFMFGMHWMGWTLLRSHVHEGSTYEDAVRSVNREELRVHDSSCRKFLDAFSRIEK